MPRPKMPLPKTTDLAFLRMVIKELNEAKTLHRFADDHVRKIRESIVKRVANALWRRYQTYLKKNEIEQMPFFDWLLARKTLENTYLHHSYATRLYWVYRVIQSVKAPEMALFGESDNENGRWYFDLLEQAINDRQPQVIYRIKLYEVYVEHQLISERVPTIRFSL